MQATCTDPVTSAPCAMDTVALDFTDGNVDGNDVYEGIGDARVWTDVGTGMIEISARRLLLTDDPLASGLVERGTSVGDIHQRSWRLAQVVPNGQALRLVVEVQATESFDQLVLDELRYGINEWSTGDAVALGPCSVTKARTIVGVPVFPGDLPVAVTDTLPVTLPLHHVHLLGPAGDLGVAPGEPETCSLASFPGFDDRPGIPAPPLTGACYHLTEPLSGWEATKGFRAVSTAGLTQIGSTGQAWAFRSTCISDPPTALTPGIDAYFSPAGDFAAKQTWLTGLLGGPPPFSATSITVLPGCNQCDPEEESLLGETRPMDILLSPYNDDGTPLVDPPGVEGADDPRQVAVHEWAHLYAGLARTFQPEEAWFDEGLATLIEVMAYPEVGADAYRLQSGYGALVANALAPGDGPRNLRDTTAGAEAKEFLQYDYGPWVIGQAIEIGSNLYGGEAHEWGVLGGWLRGPGNLYLPTTEADLQVELDTLAYPASGGFPSFYDEWVADASVGAPFVGISSASLAAGTLTLTVEQPLYLQGATAWDSDNLDPPTQYPYPWPDFSQVPFHVVCMGAALPGCTATDLGAVDAPYLMAAALDAGSRTVTVTGVPGTSITVALLANGRLLPSGPVSYAESDGLVPVEPGQRGVASTRTWFTVCEAGSTDPGCTVDGDGDGWFGGTFPGDCDDAWPLAFPGAADLWTDWGLPPFDPANPDYALDLDCDGAPDPAWYNPMLERNQ